MLFRDPPRKEVANAIKQAQRAGIKIIMITGDHPNTAQAIAKQIGMNINQQLPPITGDGIDKMDEALLQNMLLSHSVFARVKPEHKLLIVKALRAQNHVVAVTGDGVNDAPALKAADVGIAMGIRGSDVTREVADLILMDDNFATIVIAIEEGRNIFENIKKFIRYLFTTNLAEVLLVAIGASISIILGYRYADGSILLPLTAVQILWINLLTDSFPALALSLDKNIGVMNFQPQKGSRPLLDQATLIFVFVIGVLGGAISLLLLYLLPLYRFNLASTQTIVFSYLTIGQLLFAFPARRLITKSEKNPFLLGAILLGVSFQFLALMTPGLIRY